MVRRNWVESSPQIPSPENCRLSSSSLKGSLLRLVFNWSDLELTMPYSQNISDTCQKNQTQLFSISYLRYPLLGLTRSWQTKVGNRIYMRGFEMFQHIPENLESTCVGLWACPGKIWEGPSVSLLATLSPHISKTRRHRAPQKKMGN